MVAIDLDGTLLTSHKKLPLKAVRTIQDVAARGVKVVLASARPPRTVREVYGHLKLDTLQVNYNGALIHHPDEDDPVYHQPLSVELAKKLVKLARKIDKNVCVSAEILDRWYTDHVDPQLATETSKLFRPDFVGPIEFFIRRPITKLMFLAPPDRLRKVREAIAKKHEGEVAVHVSDDHLIQLVHPSVDKGAALAFLAEHYGIPREHIMAIGDAPNDVGMLRYAGLGVAVANAWPAARDAADLIVPANDDHGVHHALTHCVLDRP